MKKMKRFVALAAACVMALTMVPASVHAEEANKGSYEQTDPYGLKYESAKKGVEGQYTFEYASPYNPLLTFDHVNKTYTDWTGSSSLYKVGDVKSYVQTYCVDQYTGVGPGLFTRLNLEDSDFYSDDAAALLRSIVLKGFPAVSVEELGKAAGVDNLTVGEAVNATQLAIWQASYGDQLTIEKFVDTIYAWWHDRPAYSYGAQTRYDAQCIEEVDNGYAVVENMDTISAHVEAVYNYLMNLQPTAPMGETVSGTSFVNWDNEPTLIENTDGTYDVVISATVDVVEQDAKGDALTLSAVLGDYHTTVDLVNGEQTITLTIENVPASDIKEKMILAIDGEQTVEDVYMFEVEGGREAIQRRIGYTGMQLPVHAEVTVEPQRILYLYKSAQTVFDKESKQETIHDRKPLEGIVFDLYYIASFDEYVNGKVVLPEVPEIKQGSDSDLNYPDYTITTDKTGWATLNMSKAGLADGVYAVRERENDAILKPVDPFYIMLPFTNEKGDGWEYELIIEPKNTVITPVINKDVIEIDNNLSSIDAGEAFTWIVRTNVPKDIAGAKSYVITDTLDYRLTYADNLVVKVEEKTAKADNSTGAEDAEDAVTDMLADNVLELNADYKAEVTKNVKDDVTTTKLVVTLTKEGMKKVAKLVENAETDMELRIYFDTMVNDNAVVAEKIPNEATLNYTNSANFEFKVESDEPMVYTCGISLEKHDAKDRGNVLAGAEFMLARVATDEEVENPKIKTETLVIGKGKQDEVIFVDFYASQDWTKDKVTVVTTGEDGKALLYGLEEADYYLIETKAPAGYNLLSYPIPVTLDTVSHENIVAVANSNSFILPGTGGIGTTIFTLVGAALTLGSGAALAGKKRKEEE